MSRFDLVDIACTLLRETEKAYHLDCGNAAPVWLPKSQCEVDVDKLGNGTVTLPEWLAIEKELI